MTDLPRLYASDKEVAAMIGRSLSWLRENADMLERQCGFPRRDPAIGLRHIPSILKWADSRNERLSITKTQVTGEKDDGF